MKENENILPEMSLAKIHGPELRLVPRKCCTISMLSLERLSGPSLTNWNGGFLRNLRQVYTTVTSSENRIENFVVLRSNGAFGDTKPLHTKLKHIEHVFSMLKEILKASVTKFGYNVQQRRNSWRPSSFA